MDRFRFVIEASEAEELARASGFSNIQLLHSLLRCVETMARAPISGFNVGAIGLSSDGRIFAGVNLEFAGVPLHHSVHAEQFLITNVALHSQTDIRLIVTSAPPCGHCRQFLQEIRGAPDIGISIASNRSDSGFRSRKLSHYLPDQFGPNDLLDAETPLLLEPHENNLIVPKRNGFCNGIEDGLGAEALRAANESHAPYSGSPSGVAIVDCDGRIYRGSYMESAAFNPSFGPVQAAVVAYVADGGGAYDRLRLAVLVEKSDAKVKQEETARLLLKALSPNCDLRVRHCCSSSSSSPHLK